MGRIITYHDWNIRDGFRNKFNCESCSTIQSGYIYKWRGTRICAACFRKVTANGYTKEDIK